MSSLPRAKLIPKAVVGFFGFLVFGLVLFCFVFSEAISVRKNIPGSSAVFALIHRGAVISFRLVWFLAAFIRKAALMILNTWSQQCSIWDCWLGLTHFLVHQLKQKETLWVRIPKWFSNASELVFLFKSLQQASWINLHVPNSAAQIFSGSNEDAHRVRTAVFDSL